MHENMHGAGKVYLDLCKEVVCREAFVPVSLGQPQVGDSEHTGRDETFTRLVSCPPTPNAV